MDCFDYAIVFPKRCIYFQDSSILLTCLVPLQLYTEQEIDKTVLWQNPTPSSTRYCRPLKVEFMKETGDTIKAEEQYMAQQISVLDCTTTALGSAVLKVKHILVLSMVDGKVANTLTGTTSSQRCNVCSSGPKEMNDLKKVLTAKVNRKSLEMGLSTLHAYIRFMEWILHVSYKLDVKTYLKSKQVKAKVEARKMLVQNDLKKKAGIAGGYCKEWNWFN